MPECIVGIKLGGSAFKSPEGFRDAAAYITKMRGECYKPVPVVSAPYGVSNRLIDASRAPLSRVAEFEESLREEYRALVDGAMGDSGLKYKALEEIDSELRKLVRTRKSGDRDTFLALGENHSGMILKWVLESMGVKSVYSDGPRAGMTANKMGMLREEETSKKLQRFIGRYANKGITPIIGGYIAKCPEERRNVIMGRNTTDVTGAKVGVLGEEYQVIKEVPGVFRVEPEFADTDVIQNLSYDEAGQITWRGAKVVHPHAVNVAAAAGVPIVVKSLGDSEVSTTIHHLSGTTDDNPVAVISAGEFNIIDVVDDGMAPARGYLGIASTELGLAGVDIMDATMPSNTISFIVRPNGYNLNEAADRVGYRLRKEGYSPDVSCRQIGGISLTGEAMKGRVGTHSWLSGILGDAGVSIVAGSQSDETAGGSPVVNLYVSPDDLRVGVSAFCEELF